MPKFLPAALTTAALLLQGCAVSDEAFLEDVQRRSFAFFWEQANPHNGLIADRAPADGSKKTDVASIASVGFGLTAICIAQERGWITRDQAYQRVLTTLRFIHDELPNVHGFYYHFVDMRSGQRVWDCELSSIDTVLMLCGVLTVRQHYAGTEVAELATKIYERVEWPWMMAGGDTMSMGWTPESGFLDARWNGYSELHHLYLLAIGSPTHPIPPESWHAWSRDSVVTYDGLTFIQCAALFTHQYPHCWVDFRDKRDAHADYFRNSRLATLAQRRFCADLNDRFPHWGLDNWGLTSCDGPEGYRWMGGPPATDNLDGLLVPAAPGGSVMFAPRECLDTLRAMKKRYGDRLYTRYSFRDAFNPHPRTLWFAPDVIGIDLGATMLSIENHRTGFVWRTFMRNPEVARAMELCGLRDTSPELPPEDVRYLRDLAADTWASIASMVEPSTGLPYDNLDRGEFTSVSNIGLYLTSVAAAHALELIDEDEALARLKQTLASVEKLQTFFGFQQSWNSVTTLKPGTGDAWVSILDTGNLVGGLIAVGQAFPRFRERCDKLVSAMDWARFYDPRKGLLLGGYNTVEQKFNPHWHLGLLGTDARLCQFIAIATGGAPPEMWDRLDRGLEQKHHVKYLVPGWQGGGLFMQYISALWLDERDTFMGRSAQNFAYAQMEHARWMRDGADSGSRPVDGPGLAQGFRGNLRGGWGWSACAAPDDRYLGWGALVDEVVTPHASVLAISDFPAEVVANLRELEKLGARPGSLGFVDSVDLKTGAVARQQLVLDQGMILLSLANYLEDDVVRRWFGSHPLVRRGRALIPDYAQPRYGHQHSVYTLAPVPVDMRTK